jgi:hypothetical protein
VHDTEVVHAAERLEQRQQQPDGSGRLHRAAVLDGSAHVDATQELHHDEWLAVGRDTGVEHAHDTGVRDASAELRFPYEAIRHEAVGARRELQRDIAAQAFVVGAPYAAHPTFADALFQHVTLGKPLTHFVALGLLPIRRFAGGLGCSLRSSGLHGVTRSRYRSTRSRIQSSARAVRSPRRCNCRPPHM